ncbi:MAG TPA: deiodinase-like protein [Tepidisphaeraceae bacterium]
MSQTKQRPMLCVLAATAIALASGLSLAQDAAPGTGPGTGPGNGPEMNAPDNGAEQRRPRPQNGDGGPPPPGERGPRQGGGPGGGAMRLVQAIDKLTLTAEQKPKIDALKAEMREKMVDLRETLRDLPPGEGRNRVQELVAETREKLAAVLTPEQQAELKQSLAAAATQPARRGAGGQGPQAQDGEPGQQPGQPGNQGGGRGPAVGRLKQNLAQLDLTPEQKIKTDEIVAFAEEAVTKMRQDTQADQQELRQRAGDVMRDVQRKLADVLTPEQQEKMRTLQPRRPAPAGDNAGNNDGAGNNDNNQPRRPRRAPPEGDGMGPGDGPNNGPGKGPGNGPGNRRPPPPPDGEMGGDMNGDPPPPPPAADGQRTQRNTNPAKAGSVSSSAPGPAATAGSSSADAPADRLLTGRAAPEFKLLSLDRKTVTAASLRGRPTALIFGSYSAPLFRDKAPGLEKLRQAYRGKANVVFVYTREAYAAGEWDVERNKDAKLDIVQPATLEERRSVARQARDALKLEGDVLVDDVDDAVALAYHAEQGGCVILDAAGNVVSVQKWPEPFATKLALDELLKK